MESQKISLDDAWQNFCLYKQSIIKRNVQRINYNGRGTLLLDHDFKIEYIYHQKN